MRLISGLLVLAVMAVLVAGVAGVAGVWRTQASGIAALGSGTIVASTGGNASGTVNYTDLVGDVSTQPCIDSVIAIPIGSTGVFSRLSVNVYDGGTVGTTTVGLYLDGAITTLVVTIPGGNIEQVYTDTTHSVQATAGQRWCLRTTCNSLGDCPGFGAVSVKYTTP